MTNKEKATQIAKENKMTYLEMENDGGVYDVDSFDECEQSALQMAEWKDSQMKSIQYTWHKISDGEPKKKGWYIVYLENDTVTSYYYETYDDEGFCPRNSCQYVKVVAWTEFPKYVE